MIKGLENLPHEERLKELRLFPLETGKLREGLIMVFQYSKGSYKEEEGALFKRSHTEKTQGSRYKLHQERFHLNM